MSDNDMERGRQRETETEIGTERMWKKIEI